MRVQSGTSSVLANAGNRYLEALRTPKGSRLSIHIIDMVAWYAVRPMQSQPLLSGRLVEKQTRRWAVERKEAEESQRSAEARQS